MIPPSSCSLPPTSFLPSIRGISTTPTGKLLACIEKLRAIYNPPVRGTRRRQAQVVDGQAHDEQSILSDLREDRFELNYVLNWLTALVSRYSEELDDGVLKEASAILALCAGTASAGVFTRRFDFSVPSSSETQGNGEEHISVTLRDVPLDNDDYGSVGAQTWGGACVLSEMIVEQPGRFGLEDWDRDRPLRVLELGSGTGLVSLVAAKVLLNKGKCAEVVATDYYPAVLENLATNIASNEFGGTSQGDSVSCTSMPLDWTEFPNTPSSELPEQLREPFDVVFGADVVYEPQHAEWIRNSLERLLAKPTYSGHQPSFHLLIPLRRTHTAESESVERVFPLASSLSVAEDSIQEGGVKPDVLRVHEKEFITCDTESGEEVVYAYYRIGW